MMIVSSTSTTSHMPNIIQSTNMQWSLGDMDGWHVSEKTDAYAFGVLLWELFHCSTPFAETRYDQMTICKQVYYNGIRPRMSPHTPREIQKIIVSCWNQTADGRPTFDLVLQALEQAKQVVE